MQLSDPSHAQLEALLWTADASTSVVCGPSGNVTQLAASMLVASNAPAGELYTGQVPSPLVGLRFGALISQACTDE